MQLPSLISPLINHQRPCPHLMLAPHSYLPPAARKLVLSLVVAGSPPRRPADPSHTKHVPPSVAVSHADSKARDISKAGREEAGSVAGVGAGASSIAGISSKQTAQAWSLRSHSRVQSRQHSGAQTIHAQAPGQGDAGSRDQRAMQSQQAPALQSPMLQHTPQQPQNPMPATSSASYHTTATFAKGATIPAETITSHLASASSPLQDSPAIIVISSAAAAAGLGGSPSSSPPKQFPAVDRVLLRKQRLLQLTMRSGGRGTSPGATGGADNGAGAAWGLGVEGGSLRQGTGPPAAKYGGAWGSTVQGPGLPAEQGSAVAVQHGVAGHQCSTGHGPADKEGPQGPGMALAHGFAARSSLGLHGRRGRWDDPKYEHQQQRAHSSHYSSAGWGPLAQRSAEATAQPAAGLGPSSAPGKGGLVGPGAAVGSAGLQAHRSSSSAAAAQYQSLRRWREVRSEAAVTIQAHVRGFLCRCVLIVQRDARCLYLHALMLDMNAFVLRTRRSSS